MKNNQEPPASVEAEMRLVSAVYLDEGQTLTQCLSRNLTPRHFTDHGSCKAFELACILYRDSRPITIDAAHELMLADHCTQEVFTRFAAATGMIATTLQTADDLETVLTYAALRDVIKHTTRATELAYEPDGSLDDRLEAIRPHLQLAQEAGTPAEVRSLAIVAENAAKGLESPDIPGLPSPFQAWDKLAGPLRPGELAVLAARPGLGKTALATLFARAAVYHKAPCAFFTLEMSGEEIVERMARQALGAAAMRHELAAWIRKHLRSEKLLTIYDGASGASIGQIVARARLQSASPRGLGLVIIDYLQLVAPPQGSKLLSREQQVAATSRALKLLALELHVPVLLLAQLNREVEKEDRLPRLSDLRESGAIEQDADAVWFLHQDNSGPQFSDAERVNVLLIQKKRRNGQQDVALKLEFHRPAVRFTPLIANMISPIPLGDQL